VTLATTVADRVAELLAGGIAASDAGRPTLAATRLRAALRLLDGAGSGPAGRHAEMRGRLLVSLAWAESERGQVDLGYRLLDEAETLVPEGRRAVLHAQRAVMFRHNGRNDLALPEFDAAIAGLNERQYADDLVRALNNRSLLHLDAGRVGAARDDLDRCERIAVRHGLDLGVTLARLNIACLEVVAGDLPKALHGFTRSQAELRTLAPGMLTAAGVEKARALLAAGLLSEADAELAAAMDLARMLRQSHNYADAVQARADVALLAGRPRAAGEWAREARTQFRARRNPRRAALAALLAIRAAFDEAGPGAGLAGRARRLAGELRRLGLHEDARVALLVAARCVVRRGSPRAAERLVERGGDPGRIDALDTRLLWRLTRAEVAAAAGRPAEASRHLVAGMASLHRHRALLGCLDLRTGSSAHGQDLARAGLRAALTSGSIAAVYRWSERARAQASLLPPVRPPDDPVAAAALEELRQTRYALREAELAGRPAGALRTQVEQLQRTVREQSWSMAGPGQVTCVSPAPLSQVRSALRGAALVAYLRDGAALSALVVTGRSAAVVPLGAYRDAEEAVLRLRADLDTRAGRAMPARLAAAVAAATRQDAARLAAVVLDPVLPLIGDRDLMVVPTGLLMTTPWALLPGCAGRPVTVTPSATAWLAARRRREHRPGGTVLVAGPGIQRGEQEVRAIAELHPDAAVLTGGRAGPAATIAALNGAGVAHLAAHGRHQAENALFSTLELAGGPVLGYDLQRLDRPPAMIVLSCCELGLSDVRPGDESFGMASALLAAGTATVVASVGRVADDAAMAVMVRFHRAVAAGSAPAAALASAMRADTAAGFVCLGAG
jgi:tetratricopeptide (TPR) repeat protein